ncbi:Rv3212 family protein [Corynebacterium sp. AOP12-C2-36]|uniref:Rv3212 family protein n=1 Tax=Corynebacterium sp. AOP12-C2-36 TaxID=3457723 RepID=UPI0040334B83
MSRARPGAPAERRTRTDLAVTALITVAVLLLVVGTWFFSDSRGTTHTDSGAGEAIAPAPAAQGTPDRLEEIWRTDSLPSDTGEPVLVDGTAVARGSDTVRGISVDDGAEGWSYGRDHELCGVTGNWGRVVAVFRGPKGCSDVTSLTASTGRYQDTRSSLGGQSPVFFRSLDHVGVLDDERAELWRSDLVRTVEVGHVETPVDNEAQPLDGCRFTSAQTRKDLLAVLTDCDREDGKGTVSLEVADPEEANTPETTHEFTVPPDAELVGVAQEAAVIYVHGDGTRASDADDYTGSRFQVLHTDGSFEQHPADPSPTLAHLADGRGDEPFVAATGDLPHHMTWFDGERLVGFGPTDLEPRFTVPALGTGAAMDGSLLVPVADGVAVVDGEDGSVQRTVPVDRGSYDGPVSLRVQGDVVVEQRGDEMVALRALS